MARTEAWATLGRSAGGPAGMVRLKGVGHQGSRTGVRRCTPDGGAERGLGGRGPLGEQVVELDVTRVLFTSPSGSKTSVRTPPARSPSLSISF